MEPNELIPRPQDDSPLDDWLRANAALPPLPDDGFSHRVISALPAPRRTRPSHRGLAVTVGALVGVLVAAYPLMPRDARAPQLSGVADALQHALEVLSAPGAGIAFGVTLVSLLLAFWRDVRRVVRL